MCKNKGGKQISSKKRKCFKSKISQYSKYFYIRNVTTQKQISSSQTKFSAFRKIQ